jgi:hypothetical protein
VRSSYEHGKEPLGSIKGGEFFYCCSLPTWALVKYNSEMGSPFSEKFRVQVLA